MALSHEDKKDVKGAMGKALANKVDKVTHDNYGDYPLGDEKTYQNRKKYGSAVHPNSSAARKAIHVKKEVPNPFHDFKGFSKGIKDRIKGRKGEVKSEDIPH